MRKAILTVTLFSVLISKAQAADVTSLKCERDMRPVDGNYMSVELTKNDAGKYDVYYHVITAGFGGPVEDTRVKISQNIDSCTFAKDEARISSCYKLENEPGEQTNTGFSSKLVTETAILDTDGRVTNTREFELEVYSPQLIAGQGKPGFPHMDRPGFFSASFSAKGSSGIMLNRCTIQ